MSLCALPAALAVLMGVHTRPRARLVQPELASRSAVLHAAAGLALGAIVRPDSAIAKVEPLPGFVQDSLGASAERPFDVGGGGRRNGRSGYLNQCPSKRTRRTCVSSFDDPYDSSYVPPLTYALAEDSPAMIKASRQGLPAPAPKPFDEALEELAAAVRTLKGAVVVEAKDRYLLAEVKDPITGTTDDVEFLLSLDTPGVVNYRSAARTAAPNLPGSADDKRHRTRLKEVRVALQSKGWRSVGRIQQ